MYSYQVEFFRNNELDVIVSVLSVCMKMMGLVIL